MSARSERLADALRVLERGPGPFVIYTQRGRDSEPRTLTRECQRSWLCRALRMAGLSHLAMRGAPASAIQRLAGHSSLVVTERYMHLSPAALESAIRLLEAPAHDYAGARSERSGGLAVGGDMQETMHAGR